MRTGRFRHFQSAPGQAECCPSQGMSQDISHIQSGALSPVTRWGPDPGRALTCGPVFADIPEFSRSPAAYSRGTEAGGGGCRWVRPRWKGVGGRERGPSRQSWSQLHLGQVPESRRPWPLRPCSSGLSPTSHAGSVRAGPLLRFLLKTSRLGPVKWLQG